MFFLSQVESPGDERHYMESVTVAGRHVEQAKECERRVYE